MSLKSKRKEKKRKERKKKNSGILDSLFSRLDKRLEA